MKEDLPRRKKKGVRTGKILQKVLASIFWIHIHEKKLKERIQWVPDPFGFGGEACTGGRTPVQNQRLLNIRWIHHGFRHNEEYQRVEDFCLHLSTHLYVPAQLGQKITNGDYRNITNGNTFRSKGTCAFWKCNLKWNLIHICVDEAQFIVCTQGSGGEDL